MLKKDVKKPGQVVQQIFRRHAERLQITPDPKIPKFGEISLSSNTKDSFCCIIDPRNKMSFPIKILKMKNNTIFGVRCLNLSPFFTEPLNSAKALGIIQYTDVSDQIEVFKCSDVDFKYFRIPYHEDFVLIPILHQTFSKFSN